MQSLHNFLACLFLDICILINNWVAITPWQRKTIKSLTDLFTSMLKPDVESRRSGAAECRVGMGKCWGKNVGVLRRAEDLASTYVLRPRCRNQLSSILEGDRVWRDQAGEMEQSGVWWAKQSMTEQSRARWSRWSVDGKEDVADGVTGGVMGGASEWWTRWWSDGVCDGVMAE